MKYLSKIPFIRIWANLFIFKGKENTKQYSTDLFLYLIFSIVVTIIWTFYFSNLMPTDWAAVASFFIVCYVLVIPLISMTSRRFYTIGLPWGLCFLIFVPLLGIIWTAIVSLAANSPEEAQDKTNSKRVKTPIIIASTLSLPLSFVSIILLFVFLLVLGFNMPPIIKYSVRDYQFIFNIANTFNWGEKDIIGFGEYKYNSYLLLVPRETPKTLKKFYYRWCSGIDVDDYGFYFECKLEQEKYENYVNGLDNFTIKVGDTTRKLVKTEDTFAYPTYVVQWQNVGPKWQVFEYIMLDESENKVIYAFSMSTGYDQIIKKASYNIAPKNGVDDVPEEMDYFSIYRDKEARKYYELDEVVYDISFLDNLL